MKKLVAFILLAFVPGLAWSTVVKMNLSEALKDNSVRLEAVNYDGSYQGKTTKLQITNTTKSVIQLKVNLGIILSPDNSACQPMVLAGEEMLVVSPSKTSEIIVQTFCGNAPLHCPSVGMHYTFSRVGSDTLLKVLRFIKTNNLYDGLGQSAVWAITNNSPLSDIYDFEKEAISRQLLEFVSTVTGRQLPEYYTMHSISQVPGAPAYVPKVLKIIANFEVRLETPKVMTLGIYNEKGDMIKKVFENQEFAALGHRFGVEFESADVPAGKYYIRLKEGETIIQEKMVKVD